MGYIVIARKYRPKGFDDVVGQEGAAVTLRNAIATERIGHAYLFAGPRGVGKTSMARIFSMALNCVDGPTETPCGVCEACRDIFLGRDIDVMEIDGASNRGIDEIRAIRENAVYSPTRSRFRIFIIDEVHMLTLQAFNALLKILEEPPAHVKFLFATTVPQNIPDTIRSRCQRFDFKPVAQGRIRDHLRTIAQEEGATVEEAVLEAVARRGNGSMRDAQSLLDQLLSMGRGELTMEAMETLLGWVPLARIRQTLDLFARSDGAKALALVEELFESGRDPAEFLLQLEEYLRDLCVFNAAGQSLPVAPASAASEEDLAEQAGLFDREELLYLLQTVHATRKALRRDIEGRILLETTVIRLASIKDLPPLAAVIDAAAAQAMPVQGDRSVTAPSTVHQSRSSRSDPTPAAPTAPSDPAAALEQVRRNWPAVLERLRRQHRWASYLGGADPIRLDEKGLFLGFGPDHDFHRESVSSSEKRTEIGRVLRQMTGVDATVHCVSLREETPLPKDREDHRRGGWNRRDTAPIIKTALHVFDGKIVPKEEEE